METFIQIQSLILTWYPGHDLNHFKTQFAQLGRNGRNGRILEGGHSGVGDCNYPGSDVMTQ